LNENFNLFSDLLGLFSIFSRLIESKNLLPQLKAVYPLVIKSGQSFVDFVSHEISRYPAKTFNARDIFSRYTCDVTVRSVFGYDSEAFSPEGSEIYELGNQMMKGISESVQSMFSKKLVPKQLEERFIELMTVAIKKRTEQNLVSDDFLNHIITMKRKNNQSDEEAAAHGWTFYLDSSETSGIVALNAFYEIANDKRVQEKLRDEIMENLDENGNLPFEAIFELPYLDQVFYETLRLHPPFMFTTKVCSEDVELDGEKEHKVVMKKGSTAMISIHSIHRDPGEYS
jgi:cytochrome P450